LYMKRVLGEWGHAEEAKAKLCVGKTNVVPYYRIDSMVGLTSI